MSSARMRGEATIPKYWQGALFAVSLGKAAIAGAGLTIALLGALDILSAVTVSHLHQFIQSISLPYASAGGGAVGVVLAVILGR